MFDPRAVDTYRHDADNLFVGYKNLILQVRIGQMTMPALEHIESMGKLLLTKQKGPCGAFLIVEETAEVPDGATRAQQSRVFRELYERHPRCFATSLVSGSSVKATLLRAFGRVLVLAQPRFSITSTPREAAAWLGPRIGLGEQELLDFAAWGRKLAPEWATASDSRAPSRGLPRA